jgi:Putative stress-induced transcription regulator
MSGGHPALDRANTIDSRRGRWGPDFLHSFDDLLVLAKRTAVFDSEAVSGLREKASADPEWARAVVDEAVKLREAIHQGSFHRRGYWALLPFGCAESRGDGRA